MAFFKNKLTWLIEDDNVISGNPINNPTKGDISTSTLPDGLYNIPLYELISYCDHNENLLDSLDARLSILESGNVKPHTHFRLDYPSEWGDSAGRVVYTNEDSSLNLAPGVSTVLSRTDHSHDELYYTKTQLATSGQAIVHVNKILSDGFMQDPSIKKFDGILDYLIDSPLFFYTREDNSLGKYVNGFKVNLKNISSRTLILLLKYDDKGTPQECPIYLKDNLNDFLIFKPNRSKTQVIYLPFTMGLFKGVIDTSVSVKIIGHF